MAAVSLPCQLCALNDYEEQCFNYVRDGKVKAAMCLCGHLKNKHAMPVVQPASASVPQGMT
jgi:hypothetical protein